MKKIKGLDGLRGVSVLLVIFSHVMLFDRVGLTNPYVRRALSAHVGVSVFFVLSGFLITLLLLREHNETGKIGIRNFFARRMLRIFPLYFLAVTLVLILNFLKVISLKNCTFYYTYAYLHNFIPKGCDFSAFSHFWSLAVEEHFYIVWPFVFLLGRKAAISLLVLFICAAELFGSDLFKQYSSNYFINRWTFPAAAPIAYGCLTAYIALAIEGMELRGKPSFSAALLVAATVAVYIFITHSSQLFFCLGASLFILFVYFNQHSRTVKALEFRPLAYLGVISYGLYVWQGIFTGNGPYRQFALFPPPIDYGAILTFIIAPLSYHYFEKPILQFKQWFQSTGSPYGDTRRHA